MGTRWRKLPYRFTKTLRVDGVVTCASDADVTGTLDVTGAATFAGAADITGAITNRAAFCVPFTSPAAITTVGITLVWGVTAGNLIVPTTNSGPAVGVLAETTGAAGRPRIAIAGIQNVVAKGDGTNIAAGDRLTYNADGRAIKSQTDGDHLIGFALVACTSAETTIPALIRLGQRAA